MNAHLTVTLTLALIGGLAAGATHAQTVQCSETMSPPILAKWLSLGGSHGLGCPTMSESAAPASPKGSQSREAKFAAAAIIWHASGPRMGQTFAVSGCAYRLYFQYGGPAGWLGLPTSDPINTPDGVKQDFEGGVVTFQRAYQVCEADRAPAPPPTPATSTAPLDQFHDPAADDDLAIASATSTERALAANYQRVRTEGYVLTEAGPGLLPLKVYWCEALNAHVDVATPEDEREALAAGFSFDSAQGYIYADPHPGTKPLKLFRTRDGRRDLAVATSEGEADAMARGYVFVRIEGYLTSAP